MEGEDTALAAASVVKDGMRLVERSKVAETAPSAAAVESVTISTTAAPHNNPGLPCQDSSMRQSPATTQDKPTKKSRREGKSTNFYGWLCIGKENSWSFDFVQKQLIPRWSSMLRGTES